MLPRVRFGSWPLVEPIEMDGDDQIPTIGCYKGVPLENEQSKGRLALVRDEIDVVLGMTDARKLADWAADSWHSPESRQLACAMAESMWAVAAETRNNRPPIDLDRLRASTAGLGCKRWRDLDCHCSMLDAAGGVPREVPLADDAEQRALLERLDNAIADGRQLLAELGRLRDVAPVPAEPGTDCLFLADGNRAKAIKLGDATWLRHQRGPLINDLLDRREAAKTDA